MAIRPLQIIQGRHFGGAEQVVLSLVKCFEPCRVDSSVLCLSRGLLLDILVDSAIPNYLIPMRSEKDVLVPLFKTIRLIRDKNFDIIHTHTVRSNLIGRLAALLTKKKCVTHLHSPVRRDFADVKRGRRNEFIDSITRPIANHYIAVSQSLQRELIGKGMDPKSITTIHNGLDLAAVNIEVSKQCGNKSIKKEFKIPDDAILLVLVALIRPRKGVEVLIRAIGQVKDRFPDLFLLVVGNDDISEDPTYGRRLRELSSALGIESRVIFTGFRKDVIAILNQSDLMVLPSLFGEGLPMVILEAMAVGLPVIASNIEGVPEIIKNGVNGFLVAPGDSEELSDKITYVLNHRDILPSLKGKAVETIATEFDIQIAARKVENIYKKVLGH